MNRRTLIIGVVVVAALIVLFSVLKSKPSGVEEVSAAAKVDTDAQKLYEQAQSLKDERNLVEAKQTYQKLLSEHPDFEQIETIENDLANTNMEIIFSNVATDKTVIHEVQSGDTLGEIAKKYGTTVDLVKKSNHIESDVIRVGQKLRIWIGKFNVFVDKSQNILILKSENEVVKVYEVSTGENNSTPVGTFKVTTKLIDPVWFNKGIVVPPESPQNELGSRWLGFDIPGYGIHGTIRPESIGKQVTAGCVRMRNSDVEELYSIVPTGTEVTIVD